MRVFAWILLIATCGSSDAATDASPDSSVDRGIDAGDAGPFDASYLLVNRVMSPEGRFVLLHVLENLAPRELDRGLAIETSGVNRVEVVDGKVYVFSGESFEGIRYELDEGGSSLVETGRVSFGRFGLALFYNTFFFINETRAYYLDLDEDRVIVFDPAAMEITGDFAAPELGRADIDTTGAILRQFGDEIYVSLIFGSVFTLEAVPELNVVVLSPTEDGVLRTFNDDRCGLAGGAFVDGDHLYVGGDWATAVFDIFGPGPEPVAPPCLLRFGPDATEFEDDFYIDLRDATGRPHVTSFAAGAPGEMLLRVYDSDIDPGTLDDLFGFFSLPVWRFARFDLETQETTLIEGAPLGVWSFDPFPVDDEFYIQSFDRAEGGSTLYRLDGANVVESVSVTGDIQALHRLR
ncbi:MAG: hypothetical protein AAGE52_36390 [Myxococcota bacterium]